MSGSPSSSTATATTTQPKYLSPEDIRAMLVVELRLALKERGLSPWGNKAQLVRLLTQHLHPQYFQQPPASSSLSPHSPLSTSLSASLSSPSPSSQGSSSSSSSSPPFASSPPPLSSNVENISPLKLPPPSPPSSASTTPVKRRRIKDEEEANGEAAAKKARRTYATTNRAGKKDNTNKNKNKKRTKEEEQEEEELRRIIKEGSPGGVLMQWTGINRRRKRGGGAKTPLLSSKRMVRRAKTLFPTSTASTLSHYGDSEEDEAERQRLNSLLLKLPVTVLLRIFSCVPLRVRIGTISRVCKPWRTLVLASLSTELTADLSQKVHRGRPALELLSTYCSNLRTVRLSGVFLSDDRLKHLSRCCPLLEVVELSNAGGKALTDSGIAALCQNCPNLRDLDLSRCYQIGDTSALALSKCKKLQRVNMTYCHNVTEEGVGMLVEGQSAAALRHLTFTRCVTDDNLRQMAAHTPNLCSLSIQQSTVSKEGLGALIKGCKQLKKLNVKFCMKLKEEHVLSILRAAPHCNIKFHKWSKRAEALRQEIQDKKEKEDEEKTGRLGR
ncbi:hypothetical protein QOT17_005779 [Balamuthia mandrillaris]